MKQMVLNIIIVTYQKFEFAFIKEIDICWITKTRKFDFTSVLLASAYLWHFLMLVFAVYDFWQVCWICHSGGNAGREYKDGGK